MVAMTTVPYLTTGQRSSYYPPLSSWVDLTTLMSWRELGLSDPVLPTDQKLEN